MGAIVGICIVGMNMSNRGDEYKRRRGQIQTVEAETAHRLHRTTSTT
jgi:hypothetical protein